MSGPRATPGAPGAGTTRGTRLAIALVLTAATLLVFWPVLSCGFVSYDDGMYVTRNRHVQQGLSPESLRWAWTVGYAANWHPLTWISHMADWQLWGPAPAGHHATSLLVHVANVLLLFVLLDRTTGAPWRSALVAALFAVHPLHVESVAWVSERKDVLSTLCWVLTLLAYLRWVRRPGGGRYALIVLGLALGLAAKPMLVTLPFTLLLLDWWPLRRLGPSSPPGTAWRLVREKLPLLPLVAASCILTVVAQQHGGAIASFETYPLAARVENTFVSYVAYLEKAVWPRDLAVLYPHPGGTLSLVRVGACALGLVLATLVAVRSRHRHPYLLVGWLWYVGTLAPVIGLVQVGELAMADRYTYVPLIGVFVALAWLLPAPPVSARARAWWVVPAGAVVVLAALGVRARAQVPTWQTSITLFEGALAVNERNPTAHANLGAALVAEGRPVEAREHFERCTRLSTRCVTGHQNLGALLLEEGRVLEAQGHFEEALRLDPAYADAHLGLGQALARLGRRADAEAEYLEAVRLRSDSFGAHFNLASLLLDAGQPSRAIAHWREALRLRPEHADAHYGLGNTLVGLRRDDEAVAAYREALRLEPELLAAHFNLANALTRLGRREQAVEHYLETIRLDPSFAAAHERLADVYVATGRHTEAARHHEEALRLVRDSSPPAPSASGSAR